MKLFNDLGYDDKTEDGTKKILTWERDGIFHGPPLVEEKKENIM